MRGKSLALLMLALGCGLVASIGITQVMSKQNAEVVHAETEAVLVAIKDIPLGEAVNGENVKREEWPKDKVPNGVLGKLEELEGRRSRTRIYAGEPILAVKLFGKGASDLGASPQIPKGLRVVGVKVDSVSANSGLIMPGDRVDVLVHLQPNPTAGINEPTARTVLQFIKVFAVNDVLNVEGLDHEKSIAAKTICLLVTPEQAQKVTMASEMGQIRLVLRSPEDDNTAIDVPSFSSRELLTGKKDPSAPREASGQGPVNSDLLDFLKKNLGGKPESTAHQGGDRPLDTFRMRLFLGAAREDVVLTKYGDSQETAGGTGTWTTDQPKSGDGGAATQTVKPQLPSSAQQSPPKASPPPENGSPPGAKNSAPIAGGARG